MLAYNFGALAGLEANFLWQWRVEVIGDAEMTFWAHVWSLDSYLTQQHS